MLKKILISAIMLSMVALMMASALASTIENAIKSAPDDSTAMQLIKGYMSKTDDIDDLRILQNYWLLLDEKECLAHFTALKQKNPKDVKYIYLWGRTIPETREMMKEARKMVKKYPDFDYGYRLLLAPYQKELFSVEFTKEVAKTPIGKDFKKDKKYFAKYMKRFPGSNDAMYLNIELNVWEKKVEAANKIVAQAVSNKASFLTWQFFTDYYLRTNQQILLQTYIRRMIAESEQAKGKTPDELEQQFVLAYLSTLFQTDYLKEFKDFVLLNPQALTDPSIMQMMLIIHAEDGNADSAFELMDKMIDKTDLFYSWLISDTDLESLHADARWDAKINQMKKIWDSGKEGRRAAVVAKKISKPAPAWELKDKDGNLVKLADLKGNVVVLDFWATWCSPCRMAMPVISEWMQTSMPAGVKVYSINVWERNVEQALPFMTDNNYQMTLLYGTNDLSDKYQFDGIPYLCVIDKDGNIRYEEKGFAPELKENLSFWVEDLLK